MPTASATPLPPRVLVADDDAASRRFLGDGFRSLGAWVQDCADGLHALQIARGQAFELVLLDCRMPGAGAREVLAALRADGGASTGSVAVASSAELDSARQHELLACGFRHVLRKPCRIIDLQCVLALLPGAMPVLDDETGLRASGDASTMQALRALLRRELTQLQQELDAPERDAAAFGDRLHRLRSSCGFCGAPALAAETAYLQQQWRQDPHGAAPAIARFRDALMATLRTLGND